MLTLNAAMKEVQEIQSTLHVGVSEGKAVKKTVPSLVFLLNPLLHTAKLV